jgi:MFS family permease
MIGYGFAAYSMMMAVGRLLGDGLIPKIGSKEVLIIGSKLVMSGMILALTIKNVYTGIIGFGLVGLGVSCGAPILYGGAAKLPGLAPGEGLATMNSFAMVGFMGGPVLIGFASSMSNLVFALSSIIVFATIWFFVSRKLNF